MIEPQKTEVESNHWFQFKLGKWASFKFGPKIVADGVTLGSCLAITISYATHHHIGWAVLHGMFSWLYVFAYWVTGSWQDPVS